MDREKLGSISQREHMYKVMIIVLGYYHSFFFSEWKNWGPEVMNCQGYNHFGDTSKAET